MAKKTAKPSAGSAQGRNTREEQWRRRVAAQSQRSTQMSAAAGGDYSEDVGAGISSSTVAVATSATSAIRAAASQTQRVVPTSSMPTAPRRAPGTSAMANRTARTRMVANALSIDDEMGYIRSDIRRLVILTAICLGIIIVLAFIVR